MNTPRKHLSIRLTVPVPVEAHDAFQELADALGRSLGSVMGEWLLDTAPSARAMAEQINQMKGNAKTFANDVHALTATVMEATDQALSKAKGGAGGGPAPGGRQATKEPLTPPSSNTGGKVHGKTQKGPKGGV